jgi:hypothetical protein
MVLGWAKRLGGGALGILGGPTFHFRQIGLGFGLRGCASTKGGAS